MALHKNKWRPDTCSCEIEFSFDDSLPSDQMESSYQLVAVHKKCVAHENLTDQEVYDNVYGENRLKNFAINKIVEDIGDEVHYSAVDFDFQFDDKRKLKLTINQKDTPERKLARIEEQINLPSKVAPTPNKVSLQSSLDGVFGKGNIILE